MTVINRRQLLQLAAGLPLSGLGAFAGVSHAGDSNDTFRITLSGQALMEHPLCDDPYDGLAEIIGELKKGRVVFTDLEVAIRTKDSGEPTRDPLFLHGADTRVLDCVGEMGFNLLALSNNHAWDFGTAGVIATRDEVMRAGFACAGSGPDIAAASAAGFSHTQPSVALVAAASGKIREGAAAGTDTAGINEIRMQDDGQLHTDDVNRNLTAISAAKKEAAFVIAYLHNHQWGDDMTVTKPWAREYARQCVDAGADIFVSHGAPLLHGIELYRGKVLLHGLGSLVFHSRTVLGHYPAEVWQSAIVHCDFNSGGLQQLTVVPVVLNESGDDSERHLQTRGRPRLATGTQVDLILERLASLSEPYGAVLTIDNNMAVATIIPKV